MKMMKRNILTFFLVLSISSLAISQVYDHCDVGTLKDTCKDYLTLPYRYDASNIVLIQYRHRSQVKEVVLPMFFGEHYIFIFNTYALPPGIEIDVYDKDEFHGDRKTLFSLNSSSAKKVSVFEPGKHHRRLYVDYMIPKKQSESPDDIPDVSGCGVLVVGYR